MYIRGLFEANKHVTEPRQQRVSLSCIRNEIATGKMLWRMYKELGQFMGVRTTKC